MFRVKLADYGGMSGMHFVQEIQRSLHAFYQIDVRNASDGGGSSQNSIDSFCQDTSTSFSLAPNVNTSSQGSMEDYFSQESPTSSVNPYRVRCSSPIADVAPPMIFMDTYERVLFPVAAAEVTTVDMSTQTDAFELSDGHLTDIVERAILDPNFTIMCASMHRIMSMPAEHF